MSEIIVAYIGIVLSAVILSAIGFCGVKLMDSIRADNESSALREDR